MVAIPIPMASQPQGEVFTRGTLRYAGLASNSGLKWYIGEAVACLKALKRRG
jgi:hypothetical protein